MLYQLRPFAIVYHSSDYNPCFMPKLPRPEINRDRLKSIAYIYNSY